MADHTRKTLLELLEGRPGWRLEAQSTPGAPPLWCFVDGGEIEFSVVAERGTIHLYVMATDQELTFRDADELTVWLRRNRDGALEERAPRPEGKARARRFLDWS